MVNGIQERIATFIVENYLFGEDVSQLDPAMSLLDSGVVDSTGVLDLVSFLESEFGLSIPDRDLVPDNFDSVLRLTSYVERRSSDVAQR